MATTSWFTETGDDLIFQQYLNRVSDLRGHLAKGSVDVQAAKAQAQQVMDLLRELEAKVDEDTHELLTRTLIEWAVLQSMQLSLALESE